jgi:hypothetical protein
MLQKFVKSRYVLSAMALPGKLVYNDENQKQLIQNDGFWNKVLKVQSFIEPLIEAINKSQSENARLSDIVHLFLTNIKIFKGNHSEWLEVNERKTLEKAIEKRLEGVFIGGAHFACYFLDTRFENNLLSRKQRNSAIIFLMSQAVSTKLIQNTLEDMNDFRDLISQWEFKEGQFRNVESSESDYWRLIVSYQGDESFFKVKLAELALRLFSLPASNASVERSFSMQGLIHTKIRNKLSIEKQRKILTIQFSKKVGIKNVLKYEECDEDVIGVELDLVPEVYNDHQLLDNYLEEDSSSGLLPLAYAPEDDLFATNNY